MATTLFGGLRLVGTSRRLVGCMRAFVVAIGAAVFAIILSSSVFASENGTLGWKSTPASTPNAGPLEAAPVEKPTAPVRIEPVEEDYRLGPQDLIEVQVLGLPELHRETRVTAKGTVALPMIGTVHVGGLTSSEAEALITGLYGKDLLQNPEVSIFVKEFTRQQVTVDGAVQKPGIYPLKEKTSLLQMLAQVGGGASYADMTNVSVFRTEENERRAIKYDVNQIRAGDAPDPLLKPDDMIIVYRSAARVALRDSLFGDVLQVIFNPFGTLGVLAK